MLQTQEIAFLDIERAFDRTSIEAITPALLRYEVLTLFERWNAHMLSSRCIITSLMGETMQVASVRGCLQGGILLPHLWNQTVDGLLWELNVGITQLDLQMILLSSSEANSQAQSPKYYKMR